MQHTVAGAGWRPLPGLFRSILVVLALLALLLTTSIAVARPVRAAAGPGLKAVFIVGPSGDTAINKTRADAVAAKAAGYGMDVRKVYSPHATWANVLDNVQGANLVIYYGHGNGWPSPYGPFQEDTKDGMGLNAQAGSTTVKYYGAKWIRNYINLAPNAVVGLNHLCYASGNGEPGMPIPSWDVARQRVDNYANGFLFAGAAAVFALATGEFGSTVDMLATTNKTMDEIFSTPGQGGQAYYGFVGTNDDYFDSVRMPGNRNHLDPDSAGFRRALTGRMNVSAAEWRAGSGSGGADKPVVTAPRAKFVNDTSGVGPVTVRLVWDASASPDVVSYDLQYSKDAGAWTPMTLSAPDALTTDGAFSPKSTYRFRLRATDGSGTVGDWVYTTTRTLNRPQENATSVSYSLWGSRVLLSGASAKYVKRGGAAGASARLNFTGTDVGFVTTLGPNRGKAELWLDGELKETLDLYSPTTKAARVVWTAQVSDGSHTVEVRSLGTRNDAATGNRVDVDAFLVWK